MRRIITGIFLVLLALMIAAPAWSAGYQADVVHSSILFKIRHITGIVVGHFRSFEGRMDWNEKTASLKDVKFSIKVDSIDTFIPKRDAHLKSPDFFDAAQYPLITFVSKSESRNPKDPKEIWLKGIMTIKGVSKEVVFKMRFWGELPNPMDNTQSVAGFSGELVINRLDYKVGNGKFFDLGMVGKEVAIELNLEMLRAK